VPSRLGPLLKDFLHAYLPPDAHERCSSRTFVAWTRVVPYWRPKLVRLRALGPRPCARGRGLGYNQSDAQSPWHDPPGLVSQPRRLIVDVWRCMDRLNTPTPGFLTPSAGQQASHFKTREDLIDALLTSCHIPWYFDGRWMTKYRGHFALDGGEGTPGLRGGMS
jgi:hypothetical protein